MALTIIFLAFVNPLASDKVWYTKGNMFLIKDKQT